MANIPKIRKEIKKRGFSRDFERDILYILRKNKNDIKKLEVNFNSKRNMKHFNRLKRRFPLFNDNLTKLRKFDEYPNLVVCMLITRILEKKMGFFYKRLCADIYDLSSYLRNGKNKDGKRIYDFLTLERKKNIDEKILIKELKNSIKNIEIELSDYENESEVYEKRNIKKIGLITNDAVKCLKDFRGRTFPFLRAICLQIKPRDEVLELGVGTGILSIASVIAGAKKVVGVELNPITCILADIIVKYLEANRAVKRNSIEILWGDALNFGKNEYGRFRGKKFDVLISENIYTGMFFELQMKMISHVLVNKLIKVKKRLMHGIFDLTTISPVIPEGMTSSVELVELKGYNSKRTDEVLLDLKKRGVKVKVLSKDHVFDHIDFRVDEPPDITSVVKFKVLKNGELNAINFYSTIRMMEGDYIDRNENKFFNNDSVLILNKPMPVRRGDLIVMGIAFNEADDIKDVVLEVRKLNKDDTINEKYDTRLNISKVQHENNIKKYIRVNKCKQPLNLYRLGDYEIVRSSFFRNGYERLFLADIDYVNLKSYGA